jgi:hypothetical protein
MSDKPEVNSKKQIDLGIVLDDRDDITEHIKAKNFWIDPLYKAGHANVVYDFRSDSCIHVIEYRAFEAQALEIERFREISIHLDFDNRQQRAKIESLEQRLTTQLQAHEDVLGQLELAEESNAKLQAEIDSLKLQQLVKPQTEG